MLDNSRKENDAEHSWQLAMMAVVLVEYAPPGTQILRVLKMVLLHDIVEIDAGDSPAYTGVLKADQHAAEALAADRLFGLLPPDLEKEFRALWDEFEAVKSADALFARAMDRLQPFLHNYFTNGDMWIKHQIHAAQVRDRMAVIAKSSPQLYALIESLIEDSVRQGYLLA
ncbi:MAG: HD domain-containing protein [Devosiaceae bacterium]|nr:HD domain-containing protein [Devosiaceae bacterium]